MLVYIPYVRYLLRTHYISNHLFFSKTKLGEEEIKRKSLILSETVTSSMKWIHKLLYSLQWPLSLIRGKFYAVFKADQKGTALIGVCVCVCVSVSVCLYAGMETCNPKAYPKYSRASLCNVNAHVGHLYRPFTLQTQWFYHPFPILCWTTFHSSQLTPNQPCAQWRVKKLPVYWNLLDSKVTVAHKKTNYRKD